LKVLYFDCFAGAAGDMILGALLDAGLPFEELRRALGSLAVEGWGVSADRVIKTGITATKFACTSGSSTVTCHDGHKSRSWPSLACEIFSAINDRR
jgi:uncharacterized protein (DUF111 family)